MQANHVSLPLLRGYRAAPNRTEITGVLGSATIIGKQVCTCSHVLESIDFAKEVVLTKWNPHDEEDPWVEFTGATVHPLYDFAVLLSEQCPPFPPLPLNEKLLDMAPQVYAIGFHEDGICTTIEGRKMFQVAPRAFFGNVVRVLNEKNNKSLSVCELSFPTLSGFSGAPVLSPGLDTIVGIIYGNIQQKIQVHEKYELLDGKKVFSETVNRIMELGLFHSIQSINSFLVDLKMA